MKILIQHFDKDFIQDIIMNQRVSMLVNYCDKCPEIRNQCKERIKILLDKDEY